MFFVSTLHASQGPLQGVYHCSQLPLAWQVLSKLYPKASPGFSACRSGCHRLLWLRACVHVLIDKSGCISLQIADSEVLLSDSETFTAPPLHASCFRSSIHRLNVRLQIGHCTNTSPKHTCCIASLPPSLGRAGAEGGGGDGEWFWHAGVLQP